MNHRIMQFIINKNLGFCSYSKRKGQGECECHTNNKKVTKMQEIVEAVWQ